MEEDILSKSFKMQDRISELEHQNSELTSAHYILAESLSRYQNLFHQSPFAYLAMDANGVILEANQSLVQLLSTEQNKLHGKLLSYWIHPDDRRIFSDYLCFCRAQTGSKEVVELRLRPVSGQEPLLVQLHTTSSAHDHTGKKCTILQSWTSQNASAQMRRSQQMNPKANSWRT